MNTPEDTSSNKNIAGTLPDETPSLITESRQLGSIGEPNGGPVADLEAAVKIIGSVDLQDGDAVQNAAEQDLKLIPNVTMAKEVSQIPGIPEVLKYKADTTTFMYSVEAGSEEDFKRILDRSASLWNPWKWILFPVGPKSYSSTIDLFSRIRDNIAAQTNLSDETNALLTYWVFSTWFREVLSFAPYLLITGWAHEGGSILRAVRAFCYHPLLMAGITTANLNMVPWHLRPTLLISEPNLSKGMALLLDCSTVPGYQAILRGDRRDYFGPKAIYLGEDPPTRSMPHGLHVNASDTAGNPSKRESILSDEMVQEFQDQLLTYRVRNLQRVSKSDFNASGLSGEANAIANALGACIVDAPELREELVSLLGPQDRHQIAERFDDLGTLVVGAVLSLCHKAKDTILVGEIASEVNRILQSRGERLQFSPEKVGHKLKKIGLLTRRLGGVGNGFQLDLATQVRLHEVGAAYGCGGFVEEQSSLHCPLCQEK